MSEQVRTNTRWDNNDTYTICGQIGSGGNSNVYLIKDINDTFFVLKVSLEKSTSAEDMIQRETDAFRALEECPRRIKCIDSSAEAPDGLLADEYPWMIIDYVPGPTLFDLLEEVRGNTEKPANDLKPFLKYSLIYAIAREIADIHEKGYTHRDIKPDNIFIDPSFFPHIGDFGDLTPKQITSNAHGTINFIPPEAYPLNPSEQIQCGHPYDVFSFGGTLLEIISFEWPFSDLQKEDDFQQIVIERLRQGDLDHRFEPGGELEDQIFPEDRDFYDIVKECWTINPDERPTMEEVLERIDQSAQKHLDEEDLELFETFKENYYDEDDEDLGSSENIQTAIENGFLSPTNRGLYYAAKALDLDINDTSFSILETISDRITPSLRSARPMSMASRH